MSLKAAFALVLVCLALATPVALAAKKATGPPEFLALPFSFTGSGVNGVTNLAQNDLLVFLNGTQGSSGLIQVTVETTAGSVSLQACAVEICFRGSATLSGRKPQFVDVSVPNNTLVAVSELGDSVPWWFWISNEQPNAPASGTLHVAVVPTVVVNGTEDSIDLSVAGGELRLIKVEARVNTGAALQISYEEQTAAGTFQFFPPSDTVLPNASVALETPSYYKFAESAPFYGQPFLDFTSETFAAQFFSVNPPEAQVSGTFYLATNGGTDNVVWWVVAGSRNGQAANATLRFNRVVTQQLSDNTPLNLTATQRGELLIAKLPASAGRSGHIRANATYPATYTIAHSAGIIAGAPIHGAPLEPTGQLRNVFAGYLEISGFTVLDGSLSCAFDDNTDWWFVAGSSPVSWEVTDAALQLQAAYIDTIAVDGSAASSNVAVAALDSVGEFRLVKVSGAAGVVGLHIYSQDAPAPIIQAANVFGTGLPGSICRGSSSYSPTNPVSNFALNAVYLSAGEAQDWFLVVQVPTGVPTSDLIVQPIVAKSVALGGGAGASASEAVTLLGGDFAFGLDVQVLRIEAPANASADDIAGLTVTYTVDRLNETSFPGQDYDASDNVPYYWSPQLEVLLSHDLVLPNLFIVSGSTNAVFDVTSNFASGQSNLPALTNSSLVEQVSATSTVWTDQANLTPFLPALTGNNTAAQRRAIALLAQNPRFPYSPFKSHRVADDTTAGRVWYVVLKADISASLAGLTVSSFVKSTNFSIPLTLTVQRAAVLPLQSGVPVLSPPAPSNPGYEEPMVPYSQATLYRITGTAGLASLQILDNDCNSFTFVSPGARTIGSSEILGLRPLSTISEDQFHPVDRGDTIEDGYYASEFEANPYWEFADMGSIAPQRALKGYRNAARTSWLQAADNSDDAAWYVTVLSYVNSNSCPFTVTLRDTIALVDNPVDEYGALRWTASGIAVSPLGQYLFKLPARQALRGLIADVAVSSSDDGSAFERLESGPLAFTMQAQSVPSARAGMRQAYFQFQYSPGSSSYAVAGSLFSLPFPTMSLAASSRYTATIGSDGAYSTSATGLNDDRSDIYLLGVSRANASTGTQVVDVAVTVGQTRVMCNNKITCSGKGKCLSDGSCDCNSGYGGQFCTCRDKRDCSGHGVCGLTQGCVCDEGYSGADCSRSGAASLAVALVAVVAVALLAALL